MLPISLRHSAHRLQNVCLGNQGDPITRRRREQAHARGMVQQVGQGDRAERQISQLLESCVDRLERHKGRVHPRELPEDGGEAVPEDHHVEDAGRGPAHPQHEEVHPDRLDWRDCDLPGLLLEQLLVRSLTLPSALRAAGAVVVHRHAIARRVIQLGPPLLAADHIQVRKIPIVPRSLRHDSLGRTIPARARARARTSRGRPTGVAE
mmetsp:Transcript_16091/g.34069  ORF Transcript_16091/g.34069 Transcript_16091/m.34069 type:complete len:207 (-) Transcript_16091:12-632(-)